MSMPTSADTSFGTATVTVRVAEEGDTRALVRLAALDSAAVPERPALMAEVDGHAVAALPLGGGRAVADPFRRTSALIEMLELRATQLRDGGSERHGPSHTARLRSLVRVPRAPQLR